jgi:hypothetical protein
VVLPGHSRNYLAANCLIKVAICESIRSKRLQWFNLLRLKINTAYMFFRFREFLPHLVKHYFLIFDPREIEQILDKKFCKNALWWWCYRHTANLTFVNTNIFIGRKECFRPHFYSLRSNLSDFLMQDSHPSRIFRDRALFQKTVLEKLFNLSYFFKGRPGF